MSLSSHLHNESSLTCLDTESDTSAQDICRYQVLTQEFGGKQIKSYSGRVLHEGGKNSHCEIFFSRNMMKEISPDSWSVFHLQIKLYFS